MIPAQIEMIDWGSIATAARSVGKRNRIVWWNTHHCSWNPKAPAPRAKALGQLERLVESGARVIGLSEIAESASPLWERFAYELGYHFIASTAGVNERGGRKTTVFLVDRTLDISHPIQDRTTYKDDSAVYYDYHCAVIAGLTPEPVTVGAVYNYGGGYKHIAKQMARFAAKRTGGRIIVGGDWNLIRSTHGNAGPVAWADPAIAWICNEAGWIEVVPTRADGTSGPIDSQPVWPVKNPSVPRQLDHVFANSSRQICVTIDVDLQTAAGTWLSDHGILVAVLD